MGGLFDVNRSIFIFNMKKHGFPCLELHLYSSVSPNIADNGDHIVAVDIAEYNGMVYAVH